MYGWRSEVNSNWRYRFVNSQTTTRFRVPDLTDVSEIGPDRFGRKQTKAVAQEELSYRLGKWEGGSARRSTFFTPGIRLANRSRGIGHQPPDPNRRLFFTRQRFGGRSFSSLWSALRTKPVS
jgi:hypothetical protein